MSEDKIQPNEQQQKTIDIDGHRPVDPSNFQVEETFNSDGERPIAASDVKSNDIFKLRKLLM